METEFLYLGGGAAVGGADHPAGALAAASAGPTTATATATAADTAVRGCGISPSDLLLVAFIWKLVLEGRNAGASAESSSSSTLQGSSLAAFHVLRFVGDQIGDFTVNRRPSSVTARQLDHLQTLLPNGSNFVESVLLSLRFDSVDGLIDFVGNVDSIFTENSEYSPNGVIGPNRITKNSHVGLFVRYFLARWESLSFEKVCDFCDANSNFIASLRRIGGERSSYNMGLTNVVDYGGLGDMESVEYTIHEYFDYGGRAIPLSSTIFPDAGMDIGDKTELPTDLSSLSSFRSVDFAVSGLSAFDFSELLTSSQSRHQLSMVCLATSWARMGNHELALVAVDEAMKTAHQRNDHACVARCLLILYHVISMQAVQEVCEDVESFDDIFYKLDSIASLKESILYKCLEQSSQSKLSVLSAHSAVMLAQLRSGGLLSFDAVVVAAPFPTDFILNDGHNSTSSILNANSFDEVGAYLKYLKGFRSACNTASANASGSGGALYDYSTGSLLNVDRLGHKRWEAGDIWALLSVSSLGLTHITEIFARGNYDSLAHLLPNKPTVTAGAINTASQTGSIMTKSLIGDISFVDQVQLTCGHAFVATTCWLRLGNVFMGRLQCHRSFNILSVELRKLQQHVMRSGNFDALLAQSIEDIVLLGCKLCLLVVEFDDPIAKAFSVHGNSRQQDELFVSGAQGSFASDESMEVEVSGTRADEGKIEQEPTFERALSMLTMLDKMIYLGNKTDDVFPISLMAQSLIEVHRLHVLTRRALKEGQWHKALRLAQRVKGMVRQGKRDENKFSADFRVQFELEMESLVLVAAVVSHINVEEALTVLNCAVMMSVGCVGIDPSFGSSASVGALQHVNLMSVLTNSLRCRIYRCGLQLRTARDVAADNCGLSLPKILSAVDRELKYCLQAARVCGILSIDNEVEAILH
jgi:hypothetical protein